MASLSLGPISWRRVLPVAALLLAGAPAFAAQQSLEQAFKASYITKFAPFVEWPASAFATPASPFVICLAGRDAFGSVLDDVARGQKVRGRPLQIRRLGEAVSTGPCHILVLGAGLPDGALAQFGTQPVLTISDKSTGAGAGMIRFVQQAGRVRFEIDNAAARTARLTISSKLLGLAVTVTK